MVPSGVFAQDIVFPSDGFSKIADNVGGKVEFKRIFEQEVHYPEESLKKNIKGDVVFKFIVTKDGLAKDVRKIDSVNAEIDAEARRILNLLEFTPSVYHGESVNSYIELKFKFRPLIYKKNVKERGYEKVNYPEGYVTNPLMKIYTKADELPIYLEGNYALSAFIQKNLVYPKVAEMQRIKGAVTLSFLVEPSGYPTNIRIVKSLGFGCDEEAIRVISLVRWKPAMKDGKPVRYRMDFPLVFNLNEQFKDNSIGEQKY